MVYLMLAEGFEEIEALTPLDILRRADVPVKTVGVGGRIIKGAHNISVESDIEINDMVLDDILAIILPGGMPGTLNLKADKTVNDAVKAAYERGALIAAICAAPSVLGALGLLNGKEAICFPGFESELRGARISKNKVVKSGNIITAAGAGVAAEFGFEILTSLKNSEIAKNLRKTMLYN